jgi:hypothetical protein
MRLPDGPIRRLAACANGARSRVLARRVAMRRGQRPLHGFGKSHCIGVASQNLDSGRLCGASSWNGFHLSDGGALISA